MMEAGVARRRFWLSLAAVWAIGYAILILISWRSILAYDFSDPDDYMRLQQVRDLLAGQNWFDTRQYRVSPPMGASTHWTRLVDIPIAAVILLLTPFLSQRGAEMGALLIVPALTLAVTVALIAIITRRLSGERQAMAASVFLFACPTACFQMRPLRIDHHGWQIALALVGVAAMLDRRPWRSGLIAGAAAAVNLAVSIEGLPFVAALGGLCALRWIIHPQEGERFEGFVMGLAGMGIAAFAATQAPATWFVVHCDSLTLPYVSSFLVAALIVPVARRLPLGRAGRTAALGGIAGAVLATLGTMAPVCLGGPFAQLNPVVHNFWYLHIPEGLPLWGQTRLVHQAEIIGFPVVGLIGMFIAWQRADASSRRDWATLAFLSLAALATGIMVRRAGVLANVLAIPGGVVLMVPLLVRARQLTIMPIRVVATIIALLILSPLMPISTVAMFEAILKPETQGPMVDAKAMERCDTSANLAKLDRLPPADLLTPFDLGPAILTSTHHRLLATGHHRNQTPMRDLILAFGSSPERAHAIIGRWSIDYIVTCPGSQELDFSKSVMPDGLWAQVDRGRTPAWLERLPAKDMAGMMIWRVKD